MPSPMVTGGDPVQPELIAAARACLATGGTIDQAAKAILERTQSPVAAIKALREAQPGLSLADAKLVVHRNLPPSARAAAEQLWSGLARELAKSQD